MAKREWKDLSGEEKTKVFSSLIVISLVVYGGVHLMSGPSKKEAEVKTANVQAEATAAAHNAELYFARYWQESSKAFPDREVECGNLKDARREYLDAGDPVHYELVSKMATELYCK